MTKTRGSLQARDLTRIALLAALIALCSWIAVPTLVPFTMQTFAVFCVLELAGGWRGTLAILLYLLMGAAGLPVFAHFSGGIGALLGPTGGYLMGFLLTGLVYWGFELFAGRALWQRVTALVLGLALCYAFGTGWFMLVYSRQSGPVSLAAALGWCVLPFLLPDALKLALALLAAGRVRKLIRL